MNVEIIARRIALIAIAGILAACSQSPSAANPLPLMAPSLQDSSRMLPMLSRGVGSVRPIFNSHAALENGLLEPWNPPAGTYPLFPTSALRQPIGADPTVNPNTATWLAGYGTLGFENINFATVASALKYDFQYPIYPMSSAALGGVPVRVHCRATWGRCNVEGSVVYVDRRELPEDGGTAGEDSHMALIDTANDREYDFWGTHWPPSGGVLSIGWGGSCALNGDGFTGCVATATGTPLSLGIIRADDWLEAIKTADGTLPYAIQIATKCSNGWIAPALHGDGTTPGCAPEGSRLYLAMHDAEVNATDNTPLVKALLRTIDEDHYGMFISDTNGGSDGFGLAAESDLTYTTLGQPGPELTKLQPEAQAEGLIAPPYYGITSIPLKAQGIDFASKIKFL